MKKNFCLTLLALLFSITSFALPGIVGPSSTCTGTSVRLTDSSLLAGVWSSSNTLVATVDTATGDVYGVSAGTTTITYTAGGSFVTTPFTVYASISPITGVTSFCIGGTSVLSDATPGGTWSSSDPSVATIDSLTGQVTGSATGGFVYIYYSTGGCPASIVLTVNTTPIGGIIGTTHICAGATQGLSDSATISGTWASSNTAVATIGATSGIITGVSAGTTTITYTVNGVCGTNYKTRAFTVSNTTNAGSISGTSGIYIGSTYPLYETVSGGIWSSSNTAIATIDTSTGIVTGASTGTATITYSVSGCGGIATATYTISVTPINGISGHVNFPGTSYYGMVKIWLITYNPATLDLEATDSVSYYYNGTSIYYQFLGLVTDSYRVKAAVNDSSVITTNYIPTYHTSSFYWHSANVIYHVSGTADINENINMVYGTATSGPGFIGGNVTTGANKGTSLGVPVAGLKMNVLNSATNQLMQSARTDASGNYSFSNLPLGTYYIFPDSLNYITTAYTSITLTTGGTSRPATNFMQHTLSKTITPLIEGINVIKDPASTVFAFPNPANGKLNLQWNETTTEKGTITITDITGREIYKTIITMNEGTGIKQIDLSGFANGVYMISVKSGTLNYKSKVEKL